MCSVKVRELSRVTPKSRTLDENVKCGNFSESKTNPDFFLIMSQRENSHLIQLYYIALVGPNILQCLQCYFTMLQCYNVLQCYFTMFKLLPITNPTTNRRTKIFIVDVSAILLQQRMKCGIQSTPITSCFYRPYYALYIDPRYRSKLA